MATIKAGFERAQQLKEEGNDYYKNERFKEALRSYHLVHCSFLSYDK